MQRIALAILVSLLLLLVPNRARAEPKAELQEILLALQKWRKSFDSVSMKSELRFDDSVVYTRQFWVWKDSGQYHFEFWRYLDGNSDQPHSHEVTSIDKRIVQTLTDHGTKLRTSGDRGERMPTLPLYGIWMSETNDQPAGWLPEILSRQEVKVLGKRKVGNVECEVVQMTPQNRLGDTYHWTFVLDPTHNYLPVVRESSAALGNSEWTCSEFREVAPGIFFPSRGRLDNHPKTTRPTSERFNQSWSVSEVQINQKLAPELFDPPEPSGLRTINSVDVKTWRAAQAALAAAPAGSTPSAAQAPISTPVMLGGFLVLVLAVVLLRSRTAN